MVIIGGGWRSRIAAHPIMRPEIASKRTIAAAIGSLTDHHIFLLQATALPTTASELEEILHLWRREVALDDDILLLDCQSVDHADTARGGHHYTCNRSQQRTADHCQPASAMPGHNAHS